MQLIDIILFVLILFTGLSVVIFLLSYLGYKRKTNTNNNVKAEVNDKITKDVPQNTVEELPEKVDPVKPTELPKKNQRFEVFIPDSKTEVKPDIQKITDKKSHHPKTITIKPKQ